MSSIKNKNVLTRIKTSHKSFHGLEDKHGLGGSSFSLVKTELQ